MSGRRTVTVQTGDHGPVTLVEPEWCGGEHPPGIARQDIEHWGRLQQFVFRGVEMLAVEVTSYPFSSKPTDRPHLTVNAGSTTGEYMHFYSGDELREFVSALEAYLLELRASAAELDALLAGDMGQ